LWAGRSPPLGVWDGEPPARSEGDVSIATGDAMLLYTDGLVERRSIMIDQGLERLRSDVEHRNEATAAELASSVFRALDDAEHPDDVCLLAFRKIA
jgi:serine phosphatase RsbU (regulator of sigma subunit)